LPSHAPSVDLTRVRPYGDHLGDGIVQLSFTLPVPHGPAARKTALELAAKLGLERPEVVHHQRLLDGYTHFLLYGHVAQTLDYTAQQSGELEVEYFSEDEIDAFATAHVGRPIVGIDAMLDLKGFHGNRGLEGYRAFDAHNLGSQVPNGVLVAKAIELDADAILVSQTVTQQDLHIHNLTELVEMVEAEGRRERTILACGGSRVTNELAKELGFDAGFSRGTYPVHLASFLVREVAARIERERTPAHGITENGVAPSGVLG
jgi:beta-lysine 5,6-aminomutase beta subunit